MLSFAICEMLITLAFCNVFKLIRATTDSYSIVHYIDISTGAIITSIGIETGKRARYYSFSMRVRFLPYKSTLLNLFDFPVARVNYASIILAQ